MRRAAPPSSARGKAPDPAVERSRRGSQFLVGFVLMLATASIYMATTVWLTQILVKRFDSFLGIGWGVLITTWLLYVLNVFREGAERAICRQLDELVLPEEEGPCDPPWF